MLSPPATTRLFRLATLLGAIALALVVVMAGWFGLRATLSRVGSGLSALPESLAVHLVQLTCAGLAWGVLLPVRVPAWPMFRARWIREAVNSMLPVASIGGAVVGGRLLTRTGIDAATAAATLTADLTGETVAQVLFLAAALGLAASLPHAPISPLWSLVLVGPLLLTVIGLIVFQTFRLFDRVERLVRRMLPARLGGALQGLQARLDRVYARPGPVVANLLLHLAAWSLGAAEVWVLLRALDQPVELRTAYVIESLGLVARSVAFAVPAGLAAQETGFVMACALFGIPHQAGLALSLLKRARELIVGTSGVLYWQWLERGVWWGRGKGAALGPPPTGPSDLV